LTPNELVLTFRGSYVCANFGENQSRNATVRVLADGQTHTQTQTDFIICPMLYAIAMGQITKTLYTTVHLLLENLKFFLSHPSVHSQYVSQFNKSLESKSSPNKEGLYIPGYSVLDTD